MAPVSNPKRFLACRRAAVALEGALAISALILALVGVFDIIHTVFVGDLIQRAANSVGRACSLNYGQAADEAALQTNIEQIIKTELGGLLDFELAQNGACTGTTTSDYCLEAGVEVYDSVADMRDGTQSSETSATLGGDARDMVVVRLTLQPQTALSPVRQQFFGTAGLQAVAIVRNEGTQPTGGNP